MICSVATYVVIPLYYNGNIIMTIYCVKDANTCTFMILLPHNTAATISFEQSVYIINQNDGWLQPVLVLSIPSSTAIIAQVFNLDGSADSEFSP